MKVDLFKWFNSLPKSVRVTTAGLLATAMVIATITGAMALSFGPEQHHLMTPGSTEEGELVLYDVDIGDPDITGNDDFFKIVRESRQDDLITIEYRLTVPEKVNIDLYKIPVRATQDDQNASTTITVAVQRGFVVGMVEFFEGRTIRNLIITGLFLTVFVFLIIYYRRYVKKKIKYSGYITLFLLLTLVMASIVLLTQTNLIWKHPGTQFQQKISLQLDEPVTGSLRIIRDETSPGAADWVTFQESNSSYIFFSLEQYEYHTFVMDIQLPDALNSGRYAYGVEINPMDDDREIIMKDFRVS